MFDYIKLGFEHILDPQGYDHILFILALCASYTIRQWKQLLFLVTAFTVGHCLTLLLSGLRIVSISPDLVEFLIPVTIGITALYNLFTKDASHSGRFRYAIALIFGLIHGLGFSNFFRALTEPGESIVVPLLSFNIGIELGQLIIVAAYFGILGVASIYGICQDKLKKGISILVLLQVIYMLCS